MITCKEDLIDTYISAKDEKLVERYLAECQKYGFKWMNGSDALDKSATELYVGLDRSPELTIGNSSSDYFLNRNCSQLTLSDFKPTHTEYVKVEDSIFDLKAEFEAGELYYSEFSMGKKFVQIGAGAEHLLMGNLSSGNLYRKVEREITWQDEIAFDYALMFDKNEVSMVVDSFCVDVFIEMCHKVYHLTK